LRYSSTRQRYCSALNAAGLSRVAPGARQLIQATADVGAIARHVASFAPGRAFFPSPPSTPVRRRLRNVGSVSPWDKGGKNRGGQKSIPNRFLFIVGSRRIRRNNQLEQRLLLNRLGAAGSAGQKQ
jgi:hypothetical protein